MAQHGFDEDDDDAPECQGPDPSPRPPGFAVPPNACDCHAHILGPLALFPLEEGRSYTPPEALFSDYMRMAGALGLSRGVLVQPSVFGTNNDCMLQVLAAHRNTLRGVAVVPPDVSDESLERLAHNGVRGLRLNLVFRGGGMGLDQLEALAARIEGLRWHLQLLIDPRILPRLAPRLGRLPVDIVIDHMGYLPTEAGIDHPAFQALLKLVEGGRCWVKLSGADRVSSAGPPYRDTLPFARALIEADPTRMIWGSDWPHVAIDGPMANDGDLLDLLALWAPEPRLRQLILVENPKRLYGFEE